jgi:hypothetical protein
VQIRRDKDSLEEIERLSEMYRAIIALRSFSEENDSRTLLLVKSLGEQIWSN